MQDPIKLFEAWMADAAALPGISEPNAMSLATVSSSGVPSNRVVLLKGCGADGFVFYTNHNSRKATELKATKRAALCFLWQPLQRQVRVEGTVELVSEEESSRYYQSRPRGSQIGAWCSEQSTVIASRQVGPHSRHHNMLEVR
jgi:pyridoxamine-phosphate oxidase